jgi:hypothetical protein
MHSGIENFKNFLLDNNAYTKYCEHLHDQHNDTFENVLEYRKRNLHDVINSSLAWDQTGERQLWADLSDKWNRAFNEGKQFNHRCKSIW